MKLLQQLSYFGYEYRQMSGRYRIRMLYQWMNPAVIGILIYRLERGLSLSLGRTWAVLRIPFLPLIQLGYAYSRCDISYKADIGKGLKILHPSLGILVSGKAILGEHVVLTGGNAIGGKSGMSSGALVIGDYADLGANASVIGPCTVGNYVQVGAGAVVVNDIPDFAAVGGIPAKVLKTRKPRILMVIDQLHVGGAEKICLLQCNLLAKHGLEVTLALLTGEGILQHELVPEVKLEKLQRRKRYDKNTARELRKLASKHDLVHVHMRHIYRFVRWALWGEEKASKIILHDHFGGDKVPFLMKSFLRPSYYIGVSPWNTEWARTALGMPAEKVFLLSNTVDPGPVPAGTGRAANRKLLMVGNIRPVKNTLFALELLRNTSWELDIFSQTPDKDYLEQFRAEARKLGVEGRIRIRAEVFKPGEHAPAYNLAIHTSHSETGPLVLLEYLAAGLPFLSYRTGAVALVTEKQFPELVLPHFDAELWRLQLEKLHQEAPDAGSLQHFFQQQHGPEQYLQTCIQIYEKILRSSL